MDDKERSQAPLLKKTAAEATDGVFFNISAKPQVSASTAESDNTTAAPKSGDAELPVLLRSNHIELFTGS